MNLYKMIVSYYGDDTHYKKWVVAKCNKEARECIEREYDNCMIHSIECKRGIVHVVS